MPVTCIPSIIVVVLSLIYASQGLQSSDHQYDYIIVGGGLTGNVVASRLSEDPSTNVLLLEAGGLGNVATRTPVMWFTFAGSEFDWKYQTTPQEYSTAALNDQRVSLTAGKVLGGGSMLNVVMWVRGTRQDFDEWVTQGASGWSYDENLPYFIRSEDCQVQRFRNSSNRGIGGPIAVNEGGFQSNVGQSVMNAAKLLGYRTDYDYNGNHRLGFARVQSDVSGGLREDSARAYIDPILNDRPNLDIIIFAQVTKILFDDSNNAIGVEYLNTQSSEIIPQTVYASREVILAAGAIGTPKVLMLSGIGDAGYLRQMGIPVISDLPVGDNLQDHYGTYGLNWQIDQSFLQTVISGSITEILPTGTASAGIAALVDFTGFINTIAGPGDARDTPDIQTIALAGLSLVSDFGLVLRRAMNIRDDVWRETFARHMGDAFTSDTVFVLLLHPKSRGYVRLASNNPLDLPLVNPNYFMDPDDVETVIRGMRFMIDLFNSPAMRSMNPRFLNITIPGCPYPADPNHDGYLECIARSFTQTIYHYSGTCKMGDPRDRRSVVDPLLRVIGVNRLRIVDTSVFPSMPSGNTQATAYMLAEKAADIIRGR